MVDLHRLITKQTQIMRVTQQQKHSSSSRAAAIAQQAVAVTAAGLAFLFCVGYIPTLRFLQVGYYMWYHTAVFSGRMHAQLSTPRCNCTTWEIKADTISVAQLQQQHSSGGDVGSAGVLLLSATLFYVFLKNKIHHY